MVKKSRKKPKRAAKKTKKKSSYSDILKYYSKNKKVANNMFFVLLILVFIVLLAFQSSVPSDVQAPASTGDDQDPVDNNDVVVEKPVIDIKSLETDIHDKINEKRVELGFSELGWNTILNVVAMNHSKDMVENDYFSHEDSKGNVFSDRYKEGGFTCLVFLEGLIFRGDENILTINHGMETQDELAGLIADTLMDNFERREKILKSYWETEGIGVAASGNTIYITQNFC